MAKLSADYKIIKNTLLFIILAELLSFLGYYLPTINFISFFALAILTLVLSLRRFEYGLYILITELLIGSFGYLFYFETGGFKISLRIAIWLIIISVWLAKIISQLIKTKKIELIIFRSTYSFYFLGLFIFIALGVINGLLQNNSLSNLFFDFNNWLYFLLIFPIFFIVQPDNLNTIKKIFLAAISWLSLKTIFLAYIFSHIFNFSDLYLWVRRSGVGEITLVVPGFNRIFMQSHIFVLIGFFILLFYLLKLTTEQSMSFRPDPVLNAGTERNSLYYKNSTLSDSSSPRLVGMAKNILFSTLLLSTIIISFSRSFWLGLAVGGLFVWLIAIFKLKIKLKQFILFNFTVLAVIILSLGLVAAIIKFPYPSPSGGFNATNLLSERATKITNEAGASSRWQLLTPLWEKIKTAPILGRGFGAVVTYKSSDPRILSSSPNGEYTTYAFEWGWLDVWLKLGIFGLLAYLVLLIKIIIDALKINSYYSLALATGLIIIITVNIFSPYVNHPLGIGFLIFSAVSLELIKNSNRNKSIG